MSERKAFALSAAFLCGLLVSGVALAMSSASYAIEWDVIGGGGGAITGAGYAMNTTIGQAAVGTVSGGNYELCAGYWCGVAAPAAPPPEYKIYLPIVLKNYP